MTENEIENIVFEFIRNRIEFQKTEIEKLKKESKKRLNYFNESYNKILAFEEKHEKELDEIYKSRYQHLFMTLNEIGKEISNEPYRLLNDIEQITWHGEEKCTLTYKEFEEETGLNSRSVKKYLSILQAKEKIEIKRGIGGLIYSIKKDAK